MADERVADDDESKIVTQFLLNTVRLRQPTKNHVQAAEACAGIVTCTPVEQIVLVRLSSKVSAQLATKRLPDVDEMGLIPLTTGSVTELYIQPMLSCIGDFDIMLHNSDELAIPAGYPPPSQLPAEFQSRVKVYEIIDSEYPGHVYLVLSHVITKNATDDYNAVGYDSRQFKLKSGDVFRDSRYMPTNIEIHGPAHVIPLMDGELSLDALICTRCLFWPTQAADWPTRHRNYDWPDSATVDHVVSNGCDVVRVAHRQCRQDEWVNKYQCRLSFSRAEIVLLNSWMPVQQIVYHMLRVFVKTELRREINNSTWFMVCNYHIKILMLWACELKPRSWWVDDLNVVRICVELLHTLAVWLTESRCPHYFVSSCNLFDDPVSYSAELAASHLLSLREAGLAEWFIENYVRRCAQLCPDRVSQLFDDVSTNMKLQNAVSAVVDWRLNSAVEDLWNVCNFAEFHISSAVNFYSLTVRSCHHWGNELAKIDLCLHVYFTPFAFLHVAHKTDINGLNDELINVMATIFGHFVGKQRYSKQSRSVLSLSQAAKLMKVLVNNSRSTVQLIEIELSKAHLYRALRCKDSDSDSIYCLANAYLAVLYYTTGQYQTAIDHCTLVMRSKEHSQCSSHVVQGELLPKIDDNIDTVLGLSVLYQYVRTTALNQHQTHVSVFTTELFAHFLHIRCLSVIKSCQFTEMSPTDEVQRYIKSVLDFELPLVADVLSLKVMKMLALKCHYKPLTAHRQKSAINAAEPDTSELVELLQQSAVEHLTRYRQLQAQKFGSVATIVTTDFEALYAYKRGDYQRCLQLSTQNVHMLLYRGKLRSVAMCSEFVQLLDEDLLFPSEHMLHVLTFPEFLQLFDDEIACLIALTLIAQPSGAVRREPACMSITQLTLSLYLMTQCQLKLHHSATSLAQTLDYIEVAQTTHEPQFRSRRVDRTQRRHSVRGTLDHLTLKLTERKVMIYLSSLI